MKQCSICKLNKSLDEFNKHRTKKDGLQSHCRDCGKLRAKQRYQDNKPEHLESVRKRKLEQVRRNQEYVWNWLSKHPCIDCGEEDIVVLEFDHQRDKEMTISRAVDCGWSLKRIQSEIDKCVVRCANCHRRKTSKDFNWRILEHGTVVQR